MQAPVTVLQILSQQSCQESLDCPECLGRGERLLFDPETGSDYQVCLACQGTGCNLLGLLVHGLLKPPQGGYGPQALQTHLRPHLNEPQKKTTRTHAPLKLARLKARPPHSGQPTLELTHGHQK